MGSPQQLIGRVLGGVYRIEQVIASGSTSVVYRGTHLRLEQPLAIKVLAGSVVFNASLMARFEAEAKVQAALNHPNIVTVYDFVTDGDLHAIAMELVDGIGLDRLMHELGGPMEVPRIKTLMRPVLEAIAHAHHHGIVHRDLKPSNILVTEVGGREFPKVMDFGIAKVLAEGVSVTASGAMLGTLLFMSPEQCKALKTVDERADIYSLGITLYQMATGMVPFYSESAFDIMLAHVQSPPTPPRELAPALPEALEAVILKAIEKDPDDRYRTVAEMAAALAAATSSSLKVPKVIVASELMKADEQRDPLVGRKGLSPGDSDTEIREIDVDDVRAFHSAPTKRLDSLADAAASFEDEDTGRILQHAGLSAPRGEPTAPEERLSRGARPARSASFAPGRASTEATSGDEHASVEDADRPQPASSPTFTYDMAHGARLRLRVSSRSDWTRYFDANILGGGVFCPTNDPPAVGTTVRLEIVFVNGPRLFLGGVITWRRPQLNDPRARAGVGVQVHPAERGKLAYLNNWVLGSAPDHRRLRRLPVKLRVAYSGRTGKRVNFTRDLNEEGIFIRSRELLALNTPIQLLLMPPDNSRPYDLRGTVSRLVEAVGDRGMGISLTFGTAAEQRQFAAFVEQLEERFLVGDLPDEMLY